MWLSKLTLPLPHTLSHTLTHSNAISPSAQQPHRTSSQSINDYSLLKVLGRGSFGKVLLAEHRKTHSICAIKVLQKVAILEDDDVECVMTERRVLALGNDHGVRGDVQLRRSRAMLLRQREF